MPPLALPALTLTLVLVLALAATAPLGPNGYIVLAVIVLNNKTLGSKPVLRVIPPSTQCIHATKRALAAAAATVHALTAAAVATRGW